MNARGSITIQQAIQLVLIAAIVFIAWGAYNSAWGALFGTSNEVESTMKSFGEFVETVNDLVEEEQEFASERQSLYLTDGFTIVAFDSEEKTETDDGTIDRPSDPNCDGKACICIYEGWPGEGKVPRRCNGFTAEKKIVIHGTPSPLQHGASVSRPSVYDAIEKERLQVDHHRFVLQAGEAGIQNYYLEKVESDETIYVLLSDELGVMSGRQDYLDRCSNTEATPSACRDEPVGTTVQQSVQSPVQYCQATGAGDRCTLAPIKKCSKEADSLPVEITELCACGGKAYRSGWCGTGGEWEPSKNCFDIDSCADYSISLQDAESREHCAEDICAVSATGCTVEQSGGITNYQCQRAND